MDNQCGFLKSQSKAELHKKYQKLDDIAARNFYHGILDALGKSIIGNDCFLFRKSAELLQLIHKYENMDRIESHYKDHYPFQNTNILLLACEYNDHKIFLQILSNYCNVLNIHAHSLVSPADEKDEGRNAYYYFMRLNNVEMLRELIEKWPMPMEQHEVDVALSKSYFKLLAQKVPLTSDMIYFVEYTLNKLRLDQCIFGNLDQPNSSFKDIIQRSQLLINSVRNLILSYDKNARIINESTLYTLKHITLNLNILKRYLRCTYDRLPWEEIEFCLVTFIKNYHSTEESGIYYRFYVNKENVFKYLNEFCVQLRDVVSSVTKANLIGVKIDSLNRDRIVDDVSNKNSIFKELYATFSKIRDFYSLNRIISYIDYTLANEKDQKYDKHLEILLVEKCLQVLGESIKNSLTSPNLSTNLCNSIFECFSENLQKIMKDMRNSFSHKYGLRRRVGASTLTIYSYDNFMKIKQDLSEVRSLLKHICLRIKLEKFGDIFYELREIKSSKEYDRLKELLNGGILKFTEEEIIDEEKSKVMRTLNMADIDQDKNETKKDTSYGIMQIIQEFKSEALASNDDCLKTLFARLEQIIRDNKGVFEVGKTNYIEFITLALSLTDTMYEFAEEDLSPESVKNILEQNGAEETTIRKPQRLSTLEEECIVALLSRITDLCRSKQCISESKLAKYEHKIYSMLLIESKNLNFMKNLHSDLVLKDKSFHCNNIFLQKILDDKLDQLGMIFRKYDVQDNPKSVSSFVVTYGDSQLFLILEMLLLDILSIYGDFLRINTGIFDFHFPILVGKELRNYLAHGNCAVEILDFNIKLCIVMNCVYFVNEKPPLITKAEQIKCHQNLNEFGRALEFNERFVQSKVDFFNFLKNENFCELHGLSKIDFLSRDLEGFTVLHAAAHNVDIKIFDHCLAKIGHKTDELYSKKNRFKQNILHIATISKNFKFIKHALQNHSNLIALLDDFDYRGCMPLHYASMFGSAEMIRLLVQHDNDDVLAEDKESLKPIHKAILFNNVEAFKVLLEFEKDINEKYIRGGYAIMHGAAQVPNPEFLSILFRYNADVNIKTNEGYTPLHAACLYRQLENVKLLLARNANPNAEIHETRKTPIFFAIQMNQFEIVQTLLRNNAYVHVVESEFHYNLLHAAAEAGNPDIIKELISCNVNLHALTKSGETVIHVAVKYERYQALEVFLSLNLEVNAIDNTGFTALHMAAMQRNREIFKLLLLHKANVNMVDFVHQLTPLQAVLRDGNMDLIQCLLDFDVSIHGKENWTFAVASGNLEVVRTVLEACKPDYLQSNWRALSDLLINATRKNSCPIIKYLLEKGADFEHIAGKPCNTLQCTPLLEATLHLQLDVLKVLLEEYLCFGDPVRWFDEIGLYWYLLCRARNEDALLSIIKLFIKHGILQERGEKLLDSCIVNNNIKAVELLLNYELNVDFESLLFVISKGYSTMGKLILENGSIDLTAKEIFSRPILHIAAMSCDTAFINFFISKGCDVNVQNKNGQTPIDYAAMSGQGSIVRTLLENGANFNKSLHMAAANDHAGIAEFLLQKGADINSFDPKQTPLHYAIRYGSQNCINLLLSSKHINVNVVDDQHITPLHVAAQVGNLEVTKILIEMGADVHAVTVDHNMKPIHFALDDSHLDIIKYYVENGYIEPNDTTSQGCTFLHYAASKANNEVMEYFLGLRLDVNAGDTQGNTPLHVAALKSSWVTCKILIDHGALSHLSNRIGLTPHNVANDRTQPFFRLLHELFDLVKVGTQYDVSVFLKTNYTDLNLNAREMQEMTVLHMCVLQGREKIVEELLKYNLNVNVTDNLLNTPLHYAAKMNGLKITDDLLAAGAIYNSKNQDSRSPFDLARDKRIRSRLSLIDKCFQCLEGKKGKFIELIRTIDKREDRIKILFGPTNLHKHSLYTYIVLNKLIDVKKKIEKMFNADDLIARKAANVFSQMGEYRRAADILKPIVRKYENDYGRKNPITLEVHSELLIVLYKLNEYRHCLVENEKITEEQIKLYGENDRIVLKSREFTALILHRLGENRKALKIYEDVREKQVTFFDSSDEDVLQTKVHVVLVLIALGRFEEALKLNYEVYGVQKCTFGVNDTRTLVTLNNIAIVLNTQGKHDEALKIYEEVSNKRATVLGPTHPDTLRATHNVILALKEQKKYREAINKLKIVYKQQMSKLGENHEETLRTRYALADVLLKRGKAMEANEIIREIYPKLKNILGPNHPIVLALQMKDMFLKPQEYAPLIPGEHESSKELMSYEQEIFFQCIKKGDCKEFLSSLERNKQLINVTDNTGVTPLHLAIDNNNLPLFTILLSRGANPVTLTRNGNSILHTAVNRCNFEMVKTIIDLIQKSHNGVYFNFLEEKTKKTGKTALHVAAQKNSYEICLLLLQKGAVYDSVTLLNQRPADLTSNDHIKKLLNLIHEIFDTVVESDASVLDRIRSIPHDEIEALKGCRNTVGKTLVQYAPNERKQQIIKDLITVLKTKKK